MIRGLRAFNVPSGAVAGTVGRLRAQYNNPLFTEAPVSLDATEHAQLLSIGALGSLVTATART